MLLPNLYLFISDEYYLREANDLCTNTELISTLDECKLAIRFLKDSGSNVTFHDSESILFYPKGCYKMAKTYYNPGDRAFWNTHHSGKANENAQPICKLSE